MLRRLHRHMVEDYEGKSPRQRSKRQWVLQFFRSRKQKPQSHSEVVVCSSVPSPAAPPHPTFSMRKLMAVRHPKSPTTVDRQTAPKPPIESTTVDLPSSNDSSVSNDHVPSPPVEEHTTSTTLPPEPKEEEKVVPLSEDQFRTLFAGAPHFNVSKARGRPTAAVTYPWGGESTTKLVSDSVHPDESAFSAATLHKDPPKAYQSSDSKKSYQEYEVDAVELPSMLSAQGIERGTVGFSHFLELPLSDSLVTDLDRSQSSKDFLEATRNKELMQANPERLGIRPVELTLIHDRLIEFQDLHEAFHDSPGPMSILNNQSSGDLYANLFSKFLTPPGFDGSTDDPTGLKIQINALLRILRLKGVWYDFSLVEWRIRLGQILWSDTEPIPEHETHPLWTEREILLLQITLACELLSRLDALCLANTNDNNESPEIATDDLTEFLRIKTRKIDWDLVLARRFLENITIVNGSDAEAPTQPKSGGLLSMLGGSSPPESPKLDIILLPQHQTRQLSGLLQFALTLRWPGADSILRELAQKLGIQGNTEQILEHSPSSGASFEPTSPSVISVYGTPLQTPRSANHLLDSYFGHVVKPVLKRENSRALRIPLSPMLPSLSDPSSPTLNDVGGWLSRSFLTGLVLPGEAISHFLISTLLENDKHAIASLGDSANLYGGFTYSRRAWWSKNSIVGRVFACLQDSTECMGWISLTRLPESLSDQWHSIHSEQVPYENRLRGTASMSFVAQNSAVIPGGSLESVLSEDLVLPSDPESLSTPSITFAHWELTPINPDLIDDDNLSGPPTESDVHVPSVTFATPGQTTSHTFTLAYDVQFITSWPCVPPASAQVQASSVPHIVRRSLTRTLSRSSSKRSETLSRRNSHGYEPLLSHPPHSANIAPKRMYDADPEDAQDVLWTKPMNAHALHKSYLYKIISATDVLDEDFLPLSALHTSRSAAHLPATSRDEESEEDATVDTKKTVFVLDARGSNDLELLTRAWCAEKGLHAIIARVGRTCIACAIREARGLGVNVVIRV